MRLLIMIACAGAVGALSRYGISTAMSKTFASTGFPFGTLTVNIIGCFIIGLVMHIGLNSDIISEDWRTAITVGFLGALTTFSSFSYETIKLIEKTEYTMAFSNIAVNVIVGIAATFAGLFIAKLIIPGTQG
jgi:fluoride exporter